ncbi:hypothetical protein [Nocardia sp. NPDC047648]|uniref:hypothetical protein n=1 Tax=Nocardia sp. NPDC047648 TaxID=3155625 RepID=UPI0033CDF1EC
MSRPPRLTHARCASCQPLWKDLTSHDDLDEPGEEIVEPVSAALSDLAGTGIRVQHRDGTLWRPLIGR